MYERVPLSSPDVEDHDVEDNDDTEDFHVRTVSGSARWRNIEDEYTEAVGGTRGSSLRLAPRIATSLAVALLVSVAVFVGASRSSVMTTTRADMSSAIGLSSQAGKSEINPKIMEVVHRIHSRFEDIDTGGHFPLFMTLPHVVPITDNYDFFGFEPRSWRATWNNSVFMKPTHVSAHAAPMVRAGKTRFMLVGKVERDDEADETHLKRFHQLDIWDLRKNCHGEDSARSVAMAKILQTKIESAVSDYFGKDIEMRWVAADENFKNVVDGGFELQVKWRSAGSKKKWLEVGTGGVFKDGILPNGLCGCAFGFGLERVMMVGTKSDDIHKIWGIFLSDY